MPNPAVAHEPTPWTLDGDYIHIPDGDPVRLESAWLEDVWKGDAQAQANARRIVAAVNATADVPIGVLEEMAAITLARMARDG